jgi:hypothetical protein
MICRFCENDKLNIFLDLGKTALSNAYLKKTELKDNENTYPLIAYVCDKCFLVQVDEFKSPKEIFNSNYPYFSSYSKTWLEHSKNYVKYVTKRFDLNNKSLIIEIASNDGYLLQYFKGMDIPCLGIEPAKNTAEIAIRKGIPTISDFFNKKLAIQLSDENKKADLIIGNNVIAHTPNINDFISGMKVLLKEDGLITLEFPHLVKLIMNVEFDTIYHEHFSYLSLYTLKLILEHHGFEIFDVEEIATHGGSLRVFIKHKNNENKKTTENVKKLLDKELSIGINNPEFYKGFEKKVHEIKDSFLNFILKQKSNNKKIIAFGAAAKGNTFLNYCNIKDDIIKFVVDETPWKQGKFLPQSHIPIVDMSVLKEYKPDITIILPWNFKEEISKKLSFVRGWGGKLVTYIPKLEIT